MNATKTDVLESFCKLARPIMVQYCGKSSCIASTWLTMDVMRRFGIDFRAVPMKFQFTIASLGKSYVSGMSEEELTRTGAACIGTGWNGHLVCVSDAMGLMVDASLDQAAVHFAEIDVKWPGILLFPLDGHKPDVAFKLHAHVVMSNGMDATIEYIPTFDESYHQTEAWTDEGLPFVAEEITATIVMDLLMQGNEVAHV